MSEIHVVKTASSNECDLQVLYDQLDKSMPKQLQLSQKQDIPVAASNNLCKMNQGIISASRSLTDIITSNINQVDECLQQEKQQIEQAKKTLSQNVNVLTAATQMFQAGFEQINANIQKMVLYFRKYGYQVGQDASGTGAQENVEAE